MVGTRSGARRAARVDVWLLDTSVVSEPHPAASNAIVMTAMHEPR